MAAERCTVEQKLRGRRLGRCIHRGRSGSGERQQLILRALPSSRADRRGARGARRMDSLRSRQKGHDNFPCTHFRVVVASLFHDESHLPRNIISESSSRSFETAPRQKNLQKEGKMIHAGVQGCSKPGRSFHPPSHDRDTHLRASRSITHAHRPLSSAKPFHIV